MAEEDSEGGPEGAIERESEEEGPWRFNLKLLLFVFKFSVFGVNE